MSPMNEKEAKEQLSKIHQAADSILIKTNLRPKVAVILGTGLGKFIANIDTEVEIPFDEIPGFPRSTVQSHAGILHVGRMKVDEGGGNNGVEALIFDGRFHLYEGYAPEEIATPIRVLKVMGVETLVITNAAGGLNPHFKSGEIMVVLDHINFTGRNPLVGLNHGEIGARFPDMTRAYDRRLIEIAEGEAKKLGIRLNRGVYIGILGPSLETPAETRMLRSLGGDATGMSTVMEVISAVHAGMRVLSFSVISNVNLPDSMAPILLDDVIAAAKKAEPDLSRIIIKVIARIGEEELP